MMTSENNANRMLTKPAALLGRAGHAMRRNGAVTLFCVAQLCMTVLCVGLVACSHRAAEHATSHATNTGAASAAMILSRPGTTMREPAGDTHREHVAPLTELVNKARTNSLARAVDEETEVRPIDQAEDAAAVTPVSDETQPAIDADQARIDQGQDAAVDPARTEITNDDAGSSWAWLLAIAALIGAAAAGHILLRRRLRRAPALDHMAVVQSDDVHAESSPLQSPFQQAATDSEFEFPAHDGEASVTSALPSLGFLYQWPDDESRKHWEPFVPVDFLPESMWASATAEEREGVPMQATEAGEITKAHQDVENRAHAFASEHPLEPLFGRLEHLAVSESDGAPVLLIERNSLLPAVLRLTSEPLPPTVLRAWETALREAVSDAEGMTLPWLLISTLLLRADAAGAGEAEALYEEAETWIELGMTADHEQSAMWQARRIELDLCRARRTKGATRLLSLRSMQSRYAREVALGEPPVLFAWVDVLAFWAQCQFGDAALARYMEAEAICLRLCEHAGDSDAAQRRRAEILRQRATIEEGGVRLHSLDTAQALLDALYEHAPSADNALAVAETALARGNALPAEQAREAYSHALMHAFMAEGELRLRARALQCRLAVQWAYEHLPGATVASDVSVNLAARLEALHTQDPETLQRMAQAHLRNGDFARACALCESAWRSGRATEAALGIWREALRQWPTVANRPDQIAARQQTMRQLSIASAMR